MSQRPPAPVLLLDLDDTIVRFSAGQPDFWRLALERHLPGGCELERLWQQVRRENHEFWSDAERAYWGRQHMYEARRRVAALALAPHGVSLALCHSIADTMTELKEDAVRPFEGAVEALQRLRANGHRLGLLTNGCAAFQRRKLQRFELEPFFELILIEGEFGHGKPDARVFRAALSHFRVSPADAWMIGDNLEADVAGAQALGIWSVWHDAHGTGLPALATRGPDRVIRCLGELTRGSGLVGEGQG